MFQSAISCRDYEHFVAVCRESEEEALKLLTRYTNTDQDLLHEVVNAIHHGGIMPHIPFTHSECELQDAIASGDYTEVLKDKAQKQSNS